MSNRLYGIFGELRVPLALGLLRLSTEDRPIESQSIELIHYALDRGIRVLDTADVYAQGEADLHYGERLVRAAVDAWHGPREEVLIATKAGLARPKGKWVPNARPEHLRKAVDGSLLALGQEQLFLLLLHANDPKTPFEESLGALAELQRQGKIAHLGLCNTSIAEVRQAQRHFPMAAIQNELSVVDRNSSKDGLVDLARQLGIPFLAHRPLGGHAKVDGLNKNRAMKPLAAKHKVTPHEMALGTLLDRGYPVVPVFGATRIASVESSLRALDLRLDESDRAQVASRISFEPTPDVLAAIAPPVVPMGLRTLYPDEEPGADPEVVIVMGIQGAGKSTEVGRYLDNGFARLNRDVLGGALEDLVPQLAALLASGQKRVVLDNTYPTRASRFAVIRIAHAHGVPVRCRFLNTPIREANINVVSRMLERYGRLLGPDELKELAKTDPNLPPPLAMARWAASFEAPGLDEGFGVIDEIPFTRRPEPQFTGKGLLLDVDGTLRKTRSGELYPRDANDVEILPDRREILARWIEKGYRLFFVSNQSGVAAEKMTLASADKAFAETIAQLGLPVAEVAFCPHPAFPVACFCRKPLPGLGISLIQRHQLNRDHLVMVGDMESDERFAEAIGARFFYADRFFSEQVP